jgi:hypothetical protein
VSLLHFKKKYENLGFYFQNVRFVIMKWILGLMFWVYHQVNERLIAKTRIIVDLIGNQGVEEES